VAGFRPEPRHCRISVASSSYTLLLRERPYLNYYAAQSLRSRPSNPFLIGPVVALEYESANIFNRSHYAANQRCGASSDGNTWILQERGYRKV
jgi:hypothetical protein